MKLHPSTLCARGGVAGAHPGPLVPHISPSTTFVRDDDYNLTDGKMYLRDDADNAAAAERLLAKLEGGSEARLFASGLSSAAAVFLSLCKPGDAVVAGGVMYFGVRKWLREWGARFGVSVVLVDARDAGALSAAVAAHKPRVVWIETPGNPTLDVVDIAAAATAAHASGALLGVDSTAATPVHTRPIEHGADIVMHSATKYLNGHSDVLCGALVRAPHARVDDAWRAIAQHRHDQGALPGPFECWLLLRGMRTLPLRVQRQSDTALALARVLAARDDVVEVMYPGLASHRNHDVAARQMRFGFGGLLSVRVAGGAERALAFAKRLELFSRATSLGGVESLVEHRAAVEGPDSPTPTDLLRLSVGIEDPDDLAADLVQALDVTR
jgi:cystathionine gamma-synthase